MTAAVARHRRPRPVGRQLDLIRQVLQRLGPERQLPRQRAGAVVLIAQRRLLPQRVVGVLHRQRRQSRCDALASRPVQRRQVPRQRTERPAVARDVVQHDQQNVLSTAMLGIRNLEQMRPQRDLAGQIEATPGRSRQRRRQGPPHQPSRSQAAAAPTAATGSLAAAPRAGPGTPCAGSRAARPDRPAPASSAVRSNVPCSRTASGIT